MSELDIRAAILGCDRCELSHGCTYPVPYSSPIAPNPFVVIGEAPGETEDRQGEPFVGAAGRLLRNALAEQFAVKQGHRNMGLEAVNNLAYLNVVCCFPHGTPRPEHIDACSHHLWTQLTLLQPRLGLVVGNTALNSFLPPEATRRRPDGSRAAPESVSSLRGQWVAVDRLELSCLLLVTWHPAYILRVGGVNTLRGREFVADCRSFVDAIYLKGGEQGQRQERQPNTN